MMTRRFLILTTCLAALGVARARAQDDPPAEEPKYFENLFPVPTGTNGFEEVIRAGEGTRKAEAGYFRVGGMTLAEKRKYLAEPASQESLSLLRQGMSKNLQMPEYDPLGPLFPYALLRALSRLLSVQLYVQFADGKNAAAVQCLSDNFAISNTVKGTSVLGLLVANAMDSIVANTFVKMRDLWTLRDCQNIIQLATQQLSMPDATFAAFDSERKISLLLLDKWRKDTDELGDALIQSYEPYEDESASPELGKARAYAQTLQNDTAVRERVFGEMYGILQDQYDRSFVLIKDPTKRLQIAPTNGDKNRHPITDFVQETLFVPPQQTIQRGVENRILIQLLAIHAAIRRYQWEYEKLPAKISDIDIARPFLRDPFTGSEIIYTPESNGVTYRLASAGALMAGDDGKDARQPFAFPRSPAPTSSQ